MADNSSIQNMAIGSCTNCGSTLVFNANNRSCQCPKCGLSQDRASAGAADEISRRGGFVPGAGVVPRFPR